MKNITFEVYLYSNKAKGKVTSGLKDIYAQLAKFSNEPSTLKEKYIKQNT